MNINMELEVEIKICSICNKELPATSEYFHKDKNGKYGLYCVCKTCRKAKLKGTRKEYYQKNKEKIKNYQFDYYWDNASEIKQKARDKRFNVN